jgi:molybdopterin-guanine dinucleotide biosynthesis protein A
LHIGLTEARHPLVATVPCDSPFLPLDLLTRLRGAMEAQQADLAVAKTFEQAHPVFCLTRRTIEPHLRAFLQSGQRKIDKWYSTLKVVEVAFDDEENAFANINTLDELNALGGAAPSA